MQRVLVTGASGYVGQHLAVSLFRNGVAVRGLARGPRPAGLGFVEWQRGDVVRLAEVQRATRGCDAVVHLACLPLAGSRQDPLSDFQVNAAGTLNVVQAARTEAVRRVVYVSTAQVYGFAEDLPLGEEAPVRPASPYAASKLCGEVLCTTFARCYGLDTIVLRLFNVYGPAADASPRPTVESVFLRRAAQGQPPVIEGDPQEARDFIHVADVVRALRLALYAEAAGEVVNVGTGTMTSLRELAILVARISGLSAEPIGQEAAGRPLRLQADTRKAARILGFEAEIDLASGLSEMLRLERSGRERIAP